MDTATDMATITMDTVTNMGMNTDMVMNTDTATTTRDMDMQTGMVTDTVMVVDAGGKIAGTHGAATVGC